jgi:molybdopterin synthase catalytic subunit
MNKKPKQVFIAGPIPAEKVASVISSHGTKTAIGAHEIFLGQVRADEIEGKMVSAIEFSAYEEMAEQTILELREAVFEKFDISCLHIYHSIGHVRVGELCFLVMSSSAHRQIARDANSYLVDRIKAEVPIFGKEIFEDDSHTWKVNQ